MLLKNRIKKIAMTMTSGQDVHLFILFCADGTIQRMGSGKLGKLENEMVSGILGPEVFYQILSLIPEKMTKQGGVFESPRRRGKPCELDIVFADRMEKEIVGFRFLFGEKSSGLPKNVEMFFQGILDNTEAWYQSEMKKFRKQKDTA